MLKLILKLIFPLSNGIVLIILLFGIKQVEPLFYLLLIPAFASVVYAAVDVWDFVEQSKKAAATELADRQRRMKEMLINFKVNFHVALTDLYIATQSEITFKKIYEMSQSEEVLSKLEKKGLHGIILDLDEFAQLYRPGE